MKALRSVYRVAAAGCALLALAPGFYALTLRWAPGADFDVTGILWLLQNIPRLTAFTVATALVVAAIYLALRAEAE